MFTYSFNVFQKYSTWHSEHSSTLIDGTMAMASSTVSGQRLPRTQSCRIQGINDSFEVLSTERCSTNIKYLPQIQPAGICWEFWNSIKVDNND